MRLPILLLLFLSALCAPIAVGEEALPSAPEPSNWQSVQSLHPGASLYVNTTGGHTSCRVQTVDADSIHCRNGAGLNVVQRSEIKSVKQAHRARSAVTGLAIGFGAGLIIGAAAGGSSCSSAQKNSFLGCFNVVSRGQIAAVGGIVLGAVGAPVGYFTDFTRSTVYKVK